MTLHLYCVLSTYTPITFQPNLLTATNDTKKACSSLLIKLFSQPLSKEEDVAITPSNSGEQGIATLIITKKVVYLQNQLIPNLDDKYPQLTKIKELAQSLAEQLDLSLSQYAPVCDFVRKAQQLQGVIVHGSQS